MEFFWDLLSTVNLTETAVQFMLVNAILGLSIYVTLYTGMFSLAQAGFMAIGAYISVLLTQNVGLPLFVGIIGGALVAALIALPVGLPALRLRDIYLAIATIGFGEIVRELIVNFDNIARFFIVTFTEAERSRYTLLEGARGLKGIPKITETWHLVITVALLAYVMIRLNRSRLGRAMAAIRQDEQAASNMGIDVVFVKNLVFVLSAIIAAIAGGFSAHLTRVIQPDQYGFDKAVDILAYAVLGGTSTWVGPIIGGLTLGALPEMLRFFGRYRGVFNGLVLLLVIVYLPGGITGVPAMIRAAFRREAATDEPKR